MIARTFAECFRPCGLAKMDRRGQVPVRQQAHDFSAAVKQSECELQEFLSFCQQTVSQHD
jgi:hypothetical protein